MPARKKMSSQARREYLELMLERYRPASRKERSLLLDEMVQVALFQKSICCLFPIAPPTLGPIIFDRADFRTVWAWYSIKHARPVFSPVSLSPLTKLLTTVSSPFVLKRATCLYTLLHFQAHCSRLPVAQDVFMLERYRCDCSRLAGTGSPNVIGNEGLLAEDLIHQQP